MTDKEREELLQYMEDFIQRAKVNPELRKQFLIEAGIFSQDGKFAEPYKHLALLQVAN